MIADIVHFALDSFFVGLRLRHVLPLPVQLVVLLPQTLPEKVNLAEEENTKFINKIRRRALE